MIINFAASWIRIFVTSGEYEGLLSEAGDFFICSEKAAFTGSLVKSTCHIDFLDDLTQDCLFVGFNSGLFIKQNIQEDTKE